MTFGENTQGSGVGRLSSRYVRNFHEVAARNRSSDARNRLSEETPRRDAWQACMCVFRERDLSIDPGGMKRHAESV